MGGRLSKDDLGILAPLAVRHALGRPVMTVELVVRALSRNASWMREQTASEIIFEINKAITQGYAGDAHTVMIWRSLIEKLVEANDGQDTN